MQRFVYAVFALAAVLLISRSVAANAPAPAHQSSSGFASAAPALTVTRQHLCRGEISPCQYGQFIEYLCALTPSMFAEKVFDGSFEGVPPYRVEFRKETDRIEQPWYPDGAVHRGEFALDRPIR